MNAGRGSAIGLVLLAVLSVQFGGALASTLIPLVGVTGSVTLRLLLSGLILAAFARPRLRGRTRGDWLAVVGFGLALAAMNTSFYGSLAHLHIGVAVTVEFVGPLLLSAVLSRRLLDGAAVALAGFLRQREPVEFAAGPGNQAVQRAGDEGEQGRARHGLSISGRA